MVGDIKELSEGGDSKSQQPSERAGGLWLNLGIMDVRTGRPERWARQAAPCGCREGGPDGEAEKPAPFPGRGLDWASPGVPTDLPGRVWGERSKGVMLMGLILRERKSRMGSEGFCL